MRDSKVCLPAGMARTSMGIPAKVLTFVAVLMAAMTGHAVEPAGYVLVVQGQWLEKGQAAPLTIGAPVSPGALLMAPAPAAGDRITVIAARTGGVLLARRCEEPAACRKPMAVPAPTAPAGREGWLGPVFAAIADQPHRYVTTLSRSASPPDDGVLVWEAGQLHLASVLEGRAEGVFEVTLTPLACPGQRRCDEAPIKARLVWLPRAGRATVESSQPGLFELELRREGEAATLPPERKWVLAVAPPDVSAARARLRVAAAMADGWGEAVDADAKRAFMRATLSTSSRQ